MRKIFFNCSKYTAIIIIIVFSFSSSVSGFQDKLDTEQEIEKPELNTQESAEPKVVSVTTTDTSINGSASPASVAPSSSEQASSVASGYIEAGQSKEEVMANLQSLRFTETEATIAYQKATTGNFMDDVTDAATNSGSSQTGGNFMDDVTDAATNPGSSQTGGNFVDAVTDVATNPGSAQPDTSFMQNATSAAGTFIDAGQSKEEAIASLEDLGYTTTEAELAYDKTVSKQAEHTNNQTNQPQQNQQKNLMTTPEVRADQLLHPEKYDSQGNLKPKSKFKGNNQQNEQKKPEQNNTDRSYRRRYSKFNTGQTTWKQARPKHLTVVGENQWGSEPKPRAKFNRSTSQNKALQDGKKVALKMKGEGYSKAEIARGLNSQGYTNVDVANVFKEAGMPN